MTVYIDLLFILNFVINTLVLAGGNVLARERVHRFRLLGGAAIGALYSVLMFFPQTDFLFRVGMRLGVGALMTAVGIPTPSFRRYLRALLWFYLSLGVFGGGMYLFYTFTAAGAEMVYSNGIYYVDMPLWLLLAVSFGFYGLIRLAAFVQWHRQPHRELQAIEICCMGKYRSLTAFLDTGNTLRDPLTLSPVVIVQVQALVGLLPDALIAAVKAGKHGQLEEINCQYRELKCRLIPFRSVGESGGLMFAVRPDWIRRLPDGEPVGNVLLGLSSTILSEDNTYQALLHSAVE